MDPPATNAASSDAEITPALSAEMRAAYLLGRNLRLLEAWLDTVFKYSDDVPPWDWDWAYPKTLFGESYDQWPEDTFRDLDTSLHILVAAQAVDAAALVELRHLLNSISIELRLVAEAAGERSHDRVVEIYWGGILSRFSWANRFARQLLANGSPALRALRQIGDDVGELMANLAGLGDHEAYFTTLQSVIDCAGDCLPRETVKRLKRVGDLFPAPGSLFTLHECNCINQQLLHSLGEFDDWVITRVHEHSEIENYIVLDDRRQTLSFLGVDIPFEEFRKANALGGLKILRTLIQCPGQAVSVAKLVDGSDLCVEPAQVASYLSRFRTVLKSRKRQWRWAGEGMSEHANALMGFVLPVRAGRARTATQSTGYRLALPSRRVNFIPAN